MSHQPVLFHQLVGRGRMDGSSENRRAYYCALPFSRLENWLGILGIGESGSERSLEFGSLFSWGALALCYSATHTTAATPNLKMSRHGDILKGHVDPHRVSGSLTQATYGIVRDWPLPWLGGEKQNWANRFVLNRGSWYLSRCKIYKHIFIVPFEKPNFESSQETIWNNIYAKCCEGVGV